MQKAPESSISLPEPSTSALLTDCATETLKLTSNPRLKPKRVLFIRGTNSNLLTTIFLKDLFRLKKPYAVFLKEKQDIKPFEDASELERLAQEHNCQLFVFASHNKKRPNNVVLGRLSDEDQLIKEMIELGVDRFYSMQTIDGPKLPQEPKLCLSFEGTYHQGSADHLLCKQLWIDLFHGHSQATEKLSKADYFVKFTGESDVTSVECARIVPKFKGSRVCKIEYRDLGPDFEFKIRRIKLFTTDPLMDIPEEVEDGDAIIKPPEKGIKRPQDDLDDRMKRMKFAD